MFILDGHTPIKCTDTLLWAEWFKVTDRHVAETDVPTLDGLVRVSTVFLGVDHAFAGGPPILFESMCFNDGGAFENECERYERWEEAERGHADMVARIGAYPNMPMPSQATLDEAEPLFDVKETP
jgi:hypothetical protein